MGRKHLNKNCRFKCQNGNAVYFKPTSGDSKTTINGSGALLDNCSLKLIGSPRCGQCNMYVDPNTKGPGKCLETLVSGNWNNTANVNVSGCGVLNGGCSIVCMAMGGTIKPFRATLNGINVDDAATDVSVTLGSKEENMRAEHVESGHGTEKEKSDNDSADYVGGNQSDQRQSGDKASEDREVPYTLCDYKNCSKADECEYLKTSYGLMETDESKNAAMLKENMQAERFELYAKETRIIETLFYSGKKCSVAHHHIIPANQCFKSFPQIVKLANYYGYDINNANNGICLPTMRQGDKDVVFYAMDKTGMQWHSGPHSYASFMREIDGVGKKLDFLLIDSRPIKDYKTSVDELLQQVLANLENNKCCRAENYEEQATQFCKIINHVSKKIDTKLRQFKVSPKSSSPFFVSRKSLYYAYYSLLKDFESDIFRAGDD